MRHILDSWTASRLLPELRLIPIYFHRLVNEPMRAFYPKLSHAWSTWLPLVLLLTLHFATRWLLVVTPYFSQADYDESITGLMALDLLKGHWQIFFWGQPYMGTLEPTLVGLVFALVGPSTKAMHATLILVSSLGLVAIYLLGREVKDQKLGILAAAYWALPPLFLTYGGLYATGGHLESVVAAAWFALGICRLAFRPPARPGLWALLMGVVAGLGWWCSLLVAPLLLATGLALLIARPGLLKGPQPWLILAGFLLGSSPFWYWNLTHDFMTFRAVEHGQGHVLGNVFYLLRNVWLPTLLGDWWDGFSVEDMIPSPLKWLMVLGVYLPVLLLAMGVALRWIKRLVKRQSPLQQPLDLVVAILLAGMVAHAASAYGHRGITRYSESLYVALAVLTAYWLYLAWTWRRLTLPVLLTLLLGFNLLTHVLFIKKTQHEANLPVAQLLAQMKQLGLDRCYAQGRIGYPITFESGGKIIAADMFGWRNYGLLKLVDQSDRVAWVTHSVLGKPSPGDVKLALRMLGGQSKRLIVGDYVVWYDFRPPPPDRPLACEACRVSSKQGQAGTQSLLNGGDPLKSAWGPTHAGDWLEVDLGRAVPLARVSLLPQPDAALNPGNSVPLRLEGSLDGQHWQLLTQGTCMAGLIWQGNKPKLRESSALETAFPAKEVRYVRLTFGAVEGRDPGWSLSRLFFHTADPQGAYQPPAPARQSLTQAEAVMAAWSDDPTGPHPHFPGVPSTYRSARVHWDQAVQDLKEAMAAAPEWEEPQRRLWEIAYLAGPQTIAPAWSH